MHALARRAKRLIAAPRLWILQAAFKLKICAIFHDRTVAVVGGSPELIASGLGADIDDADIVVRINSARRLTDFHDFGCRADFIFLGANLNRSNSPIDDLSNLAHAAPPGCVIISTEKNRIILKDIRNKKAFFHKEMPKAVTLRTVRFLKRTDWKKGDKPPRSGLVCIATILFWGKPKKINVYGMSMDENEALANVGLDGAVRQYDQKRLLDNHCSCRTEISLLEHLADTTRKIKITIRRA